MEKCSREDEREMENAAYLKVRRAEQKFVVQDDIKFLIIQWTWPSRQRG